MCNSSGASRPGYGGGRRIAWRHTTFFCRVGSDSKNSRDRDWPRVEIALSEQLERRIRQPVLIYVNLDGTELPQHDSHRIAIFAKGLRLHEVGGQLLHAIVGYDLTPQRYDYDPEEIL